MRTSLRLLVALALIAPLARPASVTAQPAEAIGRPLSDDTLRDGTVTVRVIAGDPAKPVNGTEVTLMVTPANGTSPTTEQRARTDTDGRAMFRNIAQDAMVQAKTAGEGDAVVESERFPMPGSGGIKLLLSTVPMPGAGGPMAGGPMAGGAGPMAGGPVSPRAMSGQPRPQPGDAPDAITVRVSYDDFTDPAPPKDHPVILVGYRFDLAVAGKVVKTDAAGRVLFDGLDRRGATTYFAMTLLPRGDDADRLISAPVMLPGNAGIRLILSGDKRAVGVPVDDQSKIEPQPAAAVPAGEVRVALAGLIHPGDPVELVDALTGKVLLSTKAQPPAPNPDSIVATWGTGADDPVLAPGVLVISVGANGAPAGGATVEVRRKAAAPANPPAAPAPAAPAAPAPGPAGPPPPPPPPVAPVEASSWTGTVGPNGEVTFAGLPAGAELEAIVTVDGMAQAPRPVKLPAAGGRREQLAVAWEARGQASARFTGVVGGPERAFIVRAFLRGQPCLSAPFMLPASRGVSSTVLVFPRLIFAFSLNAFIDDQYLGVRGTYTLRNSSLAPFVPGTISKPEELVIPLPKGFIGATVRQDFAEAVGVDPSRGFIVREPVPPGGMGFWAFFSLETDDGSVTWDMELPYGTIESGIEIKKTPKMTLDLPPRTRAREASDERGDWYVLSPVSVQPRQRMIFSLHGLPRKAEWVRWSMRIVGAVVILILLATLALIILPQRKDTAPARSRYDQLLDELAAMGDAAGDEPGDAARRARILDELEALHRSGAARS